MPPRDNDSKARKQRAAIAKQTTEIVVKGSYVYPLEWREVSIRDAADAAVSTTRTYEVKTLPQLTGQPLWPKNREHSSCRRTCSIEVTNETTFAAVERLAKSQQHDDTTAHKIACLNFCSAKNPGGGFLRGSLAQEEAIARQSALVACLETQMESFYELNRANRNSAMYSDLAIVSPQVPFFRNDMDDLLPLPILCTVISCPAPNAGVLLRKQQGSSRDELVMQIDRALAIRAEMILRLAVTHATDDLILGAWGCAVFQNDPGQVARTFQRLLQTKYRNHFGRVIFAVFDRSDKKDTFRAFSNVFGC